MHQSSLLVGLLITNLIQIRLNGLGSRLVRKGKQPYIAFYPNWYSGYVESLVWLWKGAVQVR